MRLLVVLVFILVVTNCATNKSSGVGDNTVDEILPRISTDIETEFIYDYSQTKFVPPDNKTLLILGQSLTNINEYRDVSKYRNYPGGWSAYWAITEFSGFKEPWTTVSGDIQHHGFLASEFDMI